MEYIQKGKEVFLGTPEPYYGNNAPILLLQYGKKNKRLSFYVKIREDFCNHITSNRNQIIAY